MENQKSERKKQIVREIRKLYDEYFSIIIESESSSDDEVGILPFPYHHRIVVRQECPLQGKEESLTQLLTLPGDRNVGLREIRDFTREAEDLIIIDPYFFSGESTNASSISEELKKHARVGGKWLKRLHIIHDPNSITNNVKNAIVNMANDQGVRITSKTTDKIHDRIWIADRKRALLVGTSLNGIGNRAAFLIPLPEKDLEDILEFIDDNELSRK